MSKHWLDADVLIQAKNGLYNFTIAMKFWNFLEQHAKAGKLSCSIKIYEDLLRYEDKNDVLTKWAKQKKTAPGLFCPLSKDVQFAYREISEYVMKRYDQKPIQVAKFLAGSDGWVIAHAKCDRGTVVKMTHK